jgi:hypothetical protein
MTSQNVASFISMTSSDCMMIYWPEDIGKMSEFFFIDNTIINFRLLKGIESKQNVTQSLI